MDESDIIGKAVDAFGEGEDRLLELLLASVRETDVVVDVRLKNLLRFISERRLEGN